MWRTIKSSSAKLALVFALGLFLRLYQLGADGFWLDEIGVAQAISAPRLSQTLAVVRTHIMAMPLDYVVGWLFARFSAATFWLRLPSALWGSLSVLAAYALYRPLIGKRASLWGAFLLALSPMLVRYSQELRFYAALVFFVVWVTALGLRAVRRRKTKEWLIFIAWGVLGIFFHLYVALAWAQVAAFSLLRRRKRASLPWLTLSFLAFFLAAALGVALFGSVPAQKDALFGFEQPLNFWLGGLGFLPPLPAALPAWWFGEILLAACLLGVWLRPSLRWLALSLLAQGIFILGMDAWRGYFASARQLLPLLPFTLLFAASAFKQAQDRLPRRFSPLAPGLMLGLAFLTLLPYYRAPKTATAPILQTLQQVWQPGQQIWIAPSYNQIVYRYYAPALAQSMHPFEGDWPPEAYAPFADYLLTDPFFAPPPGFHPLYLPPADTLYPQTLWAKDPAP